MVPSLSVKRQGCVTPLLDCLLDTTFAVSRKCLICSLVRVESSAAQIVPAQIRQSNKGTTKFREQEVVVYTEYPPRMAPTIYLPGPSLRNPNPRRRYMPVKIALYSRLRPELCFGTR